MADSNQIRRAEFDFADNDPFAELTRIMGHDPRVPAQPDQPVVVASLDDQLDRELARELDFGDFDEPARPEASNWDAGMHVGANQYADEDAYEAAAPAAVAYEETVEAVAYEPQAYSEPAHAAYHDDGYDAPQLADAAIEDGFAEAFELELEAREAAPVAYVPHQPEPTYEPAPAYEPEAVAFAGDHDDRYQAYAPVDAISEMEEIATGYSEPVVAPVAVVPAVVVSQPEPAVAQAYVAPEIPVEAALPELPFEDDVVSDDVHAWEPEPAQVVATAPAASASWAPVPAQPEEPRELSLEEELSALLSVSAPAVVAAAAAPAPVRVAPTAPAPANDAWRPASHAFGRANFAAGQAAAPVVPVAQVAPLAAQTFAEPVVEEPVAPAVYDAPPVAYAPEVGETEVADFAPYEDAAAETLVAVDERVESEDFAADHLDDLLDEFELDMSADDVSHTFEEEMVATVAHDAPVTEPAAVSAYQYEPAPAAFEYAPEDDTPAIETVDVVEGPVAVTDDLDIPDVDYGTPAPPIYDDLENEFQRAFGEMAIEEPVAAQAAVSAEQPAYWDQQPAEAYDDAQQYAEQAPNGAQWQEQPYSEDYDYETDLRQAIAMSSYEEEEQEQQAPRKRGLIVAAFVAAVALIGGVGVFGMSIFGEGSDGPALVMADSDPMKVRPENPGGTTVPNQNNEVYQRVGGGTSTSGAPAQDRLITTAEEPVDIAAEDEDVLPSGITGELEGEMLSEEPFDTEADTAGLALKSDDRVEQAEELAASGELAAVAPRRVRTMVVRPDGSMVAREEPTPAPAESTQEMLVASTPTAAVPALAPAATGNSPASAEDEGPRVVTPERVAVVPAPRAAAQQPAAATQPPAAPVQQPAATPVAAPMDAGAAGQGWSMQIASQPSAEGAQSTYQDLARRYGGVLQGRGVNIVRANIEGKGVYYRVRIPASNREEAIQLCTRYKSAGGSCFVSR